MAGDGRQHGDDPRPAARDRAPGASKRASGGGKGAEAAGRGAEAAGMGAEAEAAGKGADVAGKGVDAAGKGVSAAGRGVEGAGRRVASMGESAGGKLGVAASVAGRGAEGAGKAINIAGKTLSAAGKGTSGAGKRVSAGARAGNAGQPRSASDAPNRASGRAAGTAQTGMAGDRRGAARRPAPPGRPHALTVGHAFAGLRPGGKHLKLLALIAVGALVFLVALTVLLLPAAPGGAAEANACSPERATGSGDATSTTSTRFDLTNADPPDLPALEIATRIYLVGADMGFGEPEILTAFTVALVESGGSVTMTNTHEGHLDSVGVFQQRNIAPWNARERLNVAAAATTFYEQLRVFDSGQSIGELAADIQRPAEQYRDRYGAALPRAEEFYAQVEAHLDGGGPILAMAPAGGSCLAPGAGGNANLSQAEAEYGPRLFETLPAELTCQGYDQQQVDARIYDNVVWLVRTYEMCVANAREPGHRTHGDGTAIDTLPAGSQELGEWRRTTERAARDLGWIPECGETGSRPSCPLVPAIQFIGYNGFSAHGDPANCPGSCWPHLHVSWASSDYGGCPGIICGPNEWVKAFPMTGSGDRGARA